VKKVVIAAVLLIVGFLIGYDCCLSTHNTALTDWTARQTAAAPMPTPAPTAIPRDVIVIDTRHYSEDFRPIEQGSRIIVLEWKEPTSWAEKDGHVLVYCSALDTKYLLLGDLFIHFRPFAGYWISALPEGAGITGLIGWVVYDGAGSLYLDFYCHWHQDCGNYPPSPQEES